MFRRGSGIPAVPTGPRRAARARLPPAAYPRCDDEPTMSGKGGTPAPGRLPTRRVSRGKTVGVLQPLLTPERPLTRMPLEEPSACPGARARIDVGRVKARRLRRTYRTHPRGASGPTSARLPEGRVTRYPAHPPWLVPGRRRRKVRADPHAVQRARTPRPPRFKTWV